MQEGASLINNENQMTEDTLRCPQCKSGKLNMLEIQVRKEKRHRKSIGAKFCRHCKIIIPMEKNLKFFTKK